MKMAAVVAALAVLLLTFVPPDAMSAAEAVTAAPRVHTVVIEGMRYQPQGLTVAPGDTVVWVNRDMVPHTATSATGDFDSNEIATGKSWSHTFPAAGEFAYVCAYHPLMKAVLRVR